MYQVPQLPRQSFALVPVLLGGQRRAEIAEPEADPPPPKEPYPVLSKPPLKAPPPASRVQRCVEIAESEADPPPPKEPYPVPSEPPRKAQPPVLIHCPITNRTFTEAEVTDGLQAYAIAKRPL